MKNLNDGLGFLYHYTNMVIFGDFCSLKELEILKSGYILYYLATLGVNQIMKNKGRVIVLYICHGIT